MARKSKKTYPATSEKRGKSARGLWLFKEEPNHYSYSNLEQDGKTLWEGVTNALALQNLRRIHAGDCVLYYHTGKEKAIVGEMEVIGDPFPDPDKDDPKLVVVEVKPIKRWNTPVTLGQIKKDSQLADWELVRLPRLSIVPVTDIQWIRVQELRDKQTR